MLDDISDKRVVGLKQSLRVIEEGGAALVYLAEDADREIKDKVLSLCKKKTVSVSMVQSCEELGSACGIHVGAAVVTVLKDPSI